MTERTVTSIARTARETLARPASRSSVRTDWDAVDAIRAAAAQHGLDETLGAWVPAAGASLTTLAAAFIRRYRAAYGLDAA